ncbi:hypothetical protein ACR2WA_25440 [Klebsiella pneumoniae]
MKFLVVLLCAAVLVNVCLAQDEEACCADLQTQFVNLYKKHDEQLREFIGRYYGLEAKAGALEERVAALEAEETARK